jgi:hypothetical protein
MTKIRSSSSGRVRRGGTASGGGGFGGGGGGLPIKAGGGIIGLIVVIAFIALQTLGGSGSAPSTDGAFQSGGGSPTESGSGDEVACVSEIEQIVCGAVDDVSLYWEEQYPLSFNGRYQGTDTVFFSGAVDTACGRASADLGPFYCPGDRLVYFDLDFLQQLQEQFGATGDLASQYIVAHEYGHHVQTVTGISDRVRQFQASQPDAANEFSVALELQADCFAGTWASSVAARGLFDAPNEIEEALNAASAVGDDRILESAGREVDPDLFTHGTAEQRRSWFERGYNTSDPEQCTTFQGGLAP